MNRKSTIDEFLNYIENSICYTIDTVGDRNHSLYYRELLGNKPIKVLSNASLDID